MPIKHYKFYYTYFKERPGLNFLARLFFISLFFFLLKKTYSYFGDINGYISVGKFGVINPIESLRQTLLHTSRFFLQMLEEETFLNGWVLGIPGGRISLQTPCLGINVCFAFITMIMAYPSRLSFFTKTFYILTGLFIIQVCNIIRIIGMIYVLKEGWKLPIEHHDIFNAIIYIIIFVMFYYYTSLKNKTYTVAINKVT